MYKNKVFTDNVSLKYVETQPEASAKELKWHNTLASLDVKSIHKPRWDKWWRTPKLLDRLKCESKVKTTEG
jgi:hypothetical protein